MKKTLIIAEVGKNPEGNFNVAKKLIKSAKKSGADAVKLQYIDPDKFFHRSQKKNIKKYRKFFLNKKNLENLKLFADKLKIKLFTTFFDLYNLKKLGKNFKFFKIASSDNNFKELIKEVLKKKKPTFISLGLLEKSEINNLVTFLKKIDKKVYNYVSLLYCISSYPAKEEEINLKMISFLKKKFPNFSIGYSDHSIGNEACYAAVSLGAEVIEKHFTLSKKFSKFRDHQLSADPEEMSTLVKSVRKIETMIYSKNKTNNQKKNTKIFRRSIFLKRNIKKGEKIKKKDLIYLRPEIGVKLEEENQILGKKIKIDLKKNSPIKKSYF